MKQKPLDGTSLVYTFDKAAPTRHTTQYFETTGNRAIYKDGWIASTTPLRPPWVTIGAEPNPDDFKWELYNTFDVREDTGTPVLEEYDSKMPYRFTGTFNRFVVVLHPLKLSADEQRRLHDELAKAMMAVQ